MFTKSSLLSNKHETVLTLLIFRHHKLKPQLDITASTIMAKVKKTE